MKYLKSIILFTALLLCIGTLNAQNRPNVLWLDLEDISPIMAAYGDSTVKTPNIDRLCNEGITFTNAYATVGVCAPSRASIITGMFPTAIGAQHMRVEPKSKFVDIPKYEVVPPPAVRCFTDILRENGIYTICSNKTDYQFSASPFSWDEFAKNDETDRYIFNMPKPFFKQINFWETHESQIWGWCRQNVPLKVDTSKVKIPPYLLQTPAMKLDIATEYNNLLFVDAKIGRIISELEKNSLLNNTIIILSGDHGTGLPRAKRTVYESGVKVPLIVRFPDKRMAKTYNNDLVYLMDLGATILSFYNIPTPNYMHGHDIIGKFKPQVPRKYAFFSADRFDDQYDLIRAVTNGRYKYIRNYQPQKKQFMDIGFRKEMQGVKELYYFDSLGLLTPAQATVMRKFKPTEELFDLQNDPYELTNLANHPEMAAVISELRGALDEWLRNTRDWGFTNEFEMANVFWPNKQQPVTATPTISATKNKVSLNCTTEGATVGYKFKKSDKWKIYTHGIAVKKGDSLYVAAHRLGFKTSDIVGIKF